MCRRLQCTGSQLARRQRRRCQNRSRSSVAQMVLGSWGCRRRTVVNRGNVVYCTGMLHLYTRMSLQCCEQQAAGSSKAAAAAGNSSSSPRQQQQQPSPSRAHLNNQSEYGHHVHTHIGCCIHPHFDIFTCHFPERSSGPPQKQPMRRQRHRHLQCGRKSAAPALGGHHTEA